MTYSAFCNYLERLNETSKRLEITDILAELIGKLDAKEVEKAIFLALGYLNPPYDQLKFNMADKMVARALELCYGINKEKLEKMYSDFGDLGDTAMNLASANVSPPETRQSVNQAHQTLCKVASDEGTGSQDRKVVALSNLLRTLSPLSAKYTIRIVLGTTRLGFTEQTVIDALSKMLAGDKSISRKIEETYNTHPNIGYVTKILKEKGVHGLTDIGIETGVPVLSQKAQRLSDPEEILEKMTGNAWAEYKLDGTRVQLHMDRNKTGLDTKLGQNALFDFNKKAIMVKTFTRNLEENTYQFPDVVESALKQLEADSIILDGEAVGYDPKTRDIFRFRI